MSRRDEAAAALGVRDWSDVEVQHAARTIRVTHTVELSAELSERLFVEAERRAVAPNTLMHDLVAEALAGPQAPTW